MRMMPGRYLQPKPAQIKRQVAQLKHVSAPLKGLSLSSKLVTGDPLTAVVLDNWVIEENQIKARAGTSGQTLGLIDGHPIEQLVPFYGQPNKLAAAGNGKLVLFDNTLVEDGFTSNDWSWTSFSNLSSVKYTVMANGTDGVWSWDGAAMVKETLTPPVGETWVVPDQFDKVLSHMNRLWFADSTNLAVYYLDIQSKSGQLFLLPLNAVFKRGGSIRALYTWTTDGAVNVNDQLVVFSTNGEAVIYGGVDPGPDGDFNLSGIFRFDSPMSKHSVVQYGGELYVLISTGLVPMSTLMRAESEQLGTSDRNVFSNFFATSLRFRDNPGWMAFLNPSSGRLICNMPQGGINSYSQMVRFMPNPIWATWSALPARCWGWVDNRLYFGSDDGRVYEMHPGFLNDDGDPIKVDVQAAWSNYGTPAQKQFKMVMPYLQTDGAPLPFVDIKVDYDMTPPTNQPDITYSLTGADWDDAEWDIADWAGSVRSHNNWSGVGVMGRVAGPRLTALVLDCEFSLTGWDVLFESGSIFG